jgi:hypothetical protein
MAERDIAEKEALEFSFSLLAAALGGLAGTG